MSTYSKLTYFPEGQKQFINFLFFFVLVFWTILICWEWIGVFLIMWAKIITIKITKDLTYFSLCALNLFNTRVSQFELNYWNKWTFTWHSNLLRCTCMSVSFWSLFSTRHTQEKPSHYPLLCETGSVFHQKQQFSLRKCSCKISCQHSWAQAGDIVRPDLALRKLLVSHTGVTQFFSCSSLKMISPQFTSCDKMIDSWCFLIFFSCRLNPIYTSVLTA